MKEKTVMRIIRILFTNLAGGVALAVLFALPAAAWNGYRHNDTLVRG